MSATRRYRLPANAIDRVSPVAMGLIACASVAAATLKAARAPITTDEAWSYNDWIQRGPLFIWTDYSQANNHVLHTALAWLSTRLFGSGELALRLPALLGFALLVVSAAALSRRLVRSRLLQVLCLATVTLHPYLIDFGACARGYSLGLGLSAFGLLCLYRAIEIGPAASAQRAVLSRIVAASLSFGLAVACVPVMAVPAAGLGLGFLILRTPRRRGPPAREVCALVVPGSAIVLGAYAHAFGQMTADTFWYGTRDARASLASLYQAMIYVTQSRVDALGNPLLTGPVVSWHRGLLPQVFQATLNTPAAQWTFASLLAFICAASFGFLFTEDRARALPGIALAGSLSVAAAQHLTKLGSLPLHRTWLPVVPLMLFAAWALIDALLAQLPTTHRVRPIAVAVVAAAALAFNASSIGRISFDAYREWPDNAPIPAVLRIIALARSSPGQRMSVGYVWYQEACFIYYRTRLGLDWLELPPNTATAERPVWDFMVMNSHTSRDRYPQYKLVHSFARFAEDLYRKVDP